MLLFARYAGLEDLVLLGCTILLGAVLVAVHLDCFALDSSPSPARCLARKISRGLVTSIWQLFMIACAPRKPAPYKELFMECSSIKSGALPEVSEAACLEEQCR